MRKKHKITEKKEILDSKDLTDNMIRGGYLGVLALGDIGLTAWRNKRKERK
ncbi:hypothetical protein [Neptunitalea lumnitzerae]|uniref:Uncharacterized protein n=1 Tax=Neptunitalea lumnitzerae TaxID=2965509 RepID=A0ABQ5MM52_9FLAO|nr:hypothetical protein [Neptunitalea sp. Y10]GLB50449.1 hypothetical protein Y10_28170 [Neptunitalea sp. Y10]